MEDQFRLGYEKGKLDTLSELYVVLEGFKGKEDTPTTKIMNAIFDEIYAKVVKQTEKN